MIMKFKKAYKEMNDEIHGDRALLHSILNGETKNKQSFFLNFSRRRALPALAVCFVLITTAFVSYNHFSHSSDPKQNPSVANVADTSPTPRMTRDAEAPIQENMMTNSQYYGEVLTRIAELAFATSYDDVANESQIDPLDILVDYPSKDNPSVVTISKTVDLFSIIPDATHIELDGTHIAISSSDTEAEKAISHKILK